MTRNGRTLLLIGTMTAGFAGYGCNKSPAETQNEAIEAQRQADKTAAEAREEADKKNSETMAEANKDVNKANDDAREKAAKARANANDKTREANQELAAKQGDLNQWGEKKLDEINSLIDDAKVKAQTAAPKARAQFNNAIRDVEVRRDAIKTDLASLGARADLTYDKAKDTINGRVDQLKDRIHQIERSL